MRKVVLIMLIVASMHCTGQANWQLAPPILRYNSGFFSDTTSLTINFNQPGAEIHYTNNGEEPGMNDLLYKAPIRIRKNVTIKAKAFGKGFLPSKTVAASFMKQGKEVKGIYFSPPNPAHANTPLNVLYDNIGGHTNLDDGTWLAYDRDTIEIDIELKKVSSVSSVFVSVLHDEDSWIFLPEQIELFYFDEKKKQYQPVGKEVNFCESPSPKESSLRQIIARQDIKTNKLMLIVHPFKKIPDWHTGKGKHAWVFIDEIKVY